jgi:hypothetical protein
MEDLAQRTIFEGGERFPFALGIEHFADAPADMTGTFGIGLEAAGSIGIAEGFLDAEEDGFGGEETSLDPDGFGEGVASEVGCDGHEVEEGGPIDHAGAGEEGGLAVAEADALGRDEDVAGFVDAPASGATEHLEDFVGADGDFEAVAFVGFGGEGDGAEGEVDTGGEAHGGDDDAELAIFGEGFDDACASGVGKAGMVEGDAGLEEFGEGFTDEAALGVGELEGVGVGKFAGDFGGDHFGLLTAWGEEKDGAEGFGEGLGGEAGPMAADLGRQPPTEVLGEDFVEGNRADFVSDEDGIASEASEPVDDLIGIGDGTAEEEELGVGWGEGDGQFVVQAAILIGEHLVFVDDEEAGAVAVDEAVLLGFEGGDEDGGGEVVGEIAGGDTDVPAAGAPFGEFVIGEGAGGDGVDGLAAVLAVIGPEFEDEGLAGAGGGMDDDVLSCAEGDHGFLLPEVGDGDLLECGEGRGANCFRLSD